MRSNNALILSLGAPVFYCLGTLLPCLYDQGAVKAFHFAVAYVGPQARIIPDEDCLSMRRRGFTLPFMLDKESGFVANDVARPALVPGGGAFGLGPLGFSAARFRTPLPPGQGGGSHQRRTFFPLPLTRQRSFLAKVNSVFRRSAADTVRSDCSLKIRLSLLTQPARLT